MLKKLCLLLPIILIFDCVQLFGNESISTYFPDTIGSYWVYEDQDENELKRTVIEGEEIAGETYHSFSYDPAIDDWKNFHRYVHPTLFSVGAEWITFLVGDEVEKAVEARLGKEMDVFSEFAKSSLENNLPSDLNITVDLIYSVEVEADDKVLLLPVDATTDEEWDATQINAKVTMKFEIQGLENFQNAEEMPETTFDFNILETGKILGIETVETSAGTFENCWKIEYRTETQINATQPNAIEELPGESVTTLWLADNVGVVKVHQESENIFLRLLSEKDLEDASISDEVAAEIKSASVTTLELKEYEIKPDVSQDNPSN